MCAKRKIMFAENLKFYRQRQGLTQEELAQTIGFSSKSVSKWESRNGFPTIETLVILAEIFSVSADELLYQKNEEPYFLGIDGGATKTEFLLTDIRGNVIKRVIIGSTNPNDVGMNAAKQILCDGIREVSAGIPYSNISVFAGISGGTTGDNKEIFAKALKGFGFGCCSNGSDMNNILALGKYENEIFVILGTGVVAYAKKGSKLKRISGWGQFFDDGGSGYNLGRDAIHSDLCSIDGTGEKTLISKLIEKKTGENSEKHLSKFYEKGKRYIASFSDVVFDAYGMGDGAAKNILERNMQAVAKIVDVGAEFIGEKNINVLFAGGVSNKADIIFPIIKKYLKNTSVVLVKNDKSPVCGAVEMAKRQYGKIGVTK